MYLERLESRWEGELPTSLSKSCIYTVLINVPLHALKCDIC